MSNQLLTISKITMKALEVLENQLTFSANVERSYDDQFQNGGGKIGSTVNVRKPARYVVTSGQALVPQNSVETYVPVTLTNQDNVGLSFSSVDLALNIDDFSDRFIKPASAALANKIDYNGLQMAMKSTYNFVGTLGELVGTPTTAQALLAVARAGQKLDENAAPIDGDRSAVVGPATRTGLVTANATLFNPQAQVSEIFSKGNMGKNVLGFDFYNDQNIPTLTAGTQNATFAGATVSGGQGGTNTIQADATTAFTLNTAAITGTLTAGTVFTISTVFSVNPQSRISTGNLQQFVVQADTLASATAVSILPYPIFSGAFQNCTSATGTIPTQATCTILSGLNSNSYQQNICFHKSAFTLACADLPLPQGVQNAARASSKAGGLSIRIVGQYDIQSDNYFTRLDVLYGWKALYPELAVRLTG